MNGRMENRSHQAYRQNRDHLGAVAKDVGATEARKIAAECGGTIVRCLQRTGGIIRDLAASRCRRADQPIDCTE
jgi:hypothetical protein